MPAPVVSLPSRIRTVSRQMEEEQHETSIRICLGGIVIFASRPEALER